MYDGFKGTMAEDGGDRLKSMLVSNRAAFVTYVVESAVKHCMGQTADPERMKPFLEA